MLAAPLARAAAALPRRGFATVRVTMRAAPITGASLTEGVGVVAEAGGGFAKGDVVYATGVSASWGDARPVDVEAARAVKLPAGTPAARGAHFGAAATAQGLLEGVGKGDAVLHLGAEGAVGQVVAQLCAARGAHAVSLVGADVLDPEDAVEVLKGVGAFAAAPAHFAASPAFRAVIADLPAPPKLLVADLAAVDVAAVDAVLVAMRGGVAAGRAAVDAADARDVRDAKALATCRALCAADAAVSTYNARGGAAPLSGATAFALDASLASVDPAAALSATVFAEAHNTDTLPRAIHAANGAVYKHPYRQQVWLADPAAAAAAA